MKNAGTIVILTILAIIMVFSEKDPTLMGMILITAIELLVLKSLK